MRADDYISLIYSIDWLHGEERKGGFLCERSFEHGRRIERHGEPIGFYDMKRQIGYFYVQILNVMRILVVFALTTLSIFCLKAQQSLIDTLTLGLEQAQTEYDQVDYCLGLSKAYFKMGALKQSDSILDVGYQIARSTNDLEAIAVAQVYKARSMKRSGNKGEAYRNMLQEAYENAIASGKDEAHVFAITELALDNLITTHDGAASLKLLDEVAPERVKGVMLLTLAAYYRNRAICQLQVGNVDENLKDLDIAVALLDSLVQKPDNHHRLSRPSSIYMIGLEPYLMDTKALSAQGMRRAGRLEEARDVLFDVYTWAKEYKAAPLAYGMAFQLGHININLGENTEAIGYIREAIQGWEKSPSSLNNLAKAIGLLAHVYSSAEDHASAVSAFQKTAELAAEQRDTILYLQGLCAKFTSLLAMDSTARVGREIDEAIQIADKHGSEYSTIQLAEVEAKYFMATQQYDKANESFERVLEYYAMNQQHATFQAQMLEYLAKNEMKRGDFERAETYANRFADVAARSNLNYQKAEAHKILSSIYKEKNEYEKALAAFEMFYETEGDIRKTDAQKILKEEQVRQNVNQFKKEKQLADEKAVLLEAQNRLYILLAAAFLALLLLGAYLFYRMRLAKQVIEKKNKQLAELNATKDKFFSIIAHDIRSPMVALEGVEGQINYFLENGKMNRLKDLSSKIGRTAKGLQNLLDNLLNWALIQRGVLPHNPTAVNLQEVVLETMEMFRFSAEQKDLTLQSDISGDLMVTADRTGLSTIVRNLIGNALKFTPRGGQIQLSAEILEHHIALKVKDSGQGMSQEKVSTIFDLKANRDRGTEGEKGTGLGMILCKELAEVNQAEISVESVLDQGTIVQVNIPTAA